MNDVLKMLEDKMQKTFESMSNQFIKLRTGRASVSILDDIKINYYGEPTPVKQLCNISTPEPRLIVIQPWDKTSLTDIEKAILSANIGITPENDGKVIRLPFQPLTEDKRKEIVKQIKKLSEDTKIGVRNIRREGNDMAKQKEKDSEITEDEHKRYQKDIQDLTDKWIDKITEAANNKESEVMSI
ncbi:MAG: ribosome recycling factor [Candidatus Cloacimonadia bacterium]